MSIEDMRDALRGVVLLLCTQDAARDACDLYRQDRAWEKLTKQMQPSWPVRAVFKHGLNRI